MKSITREEQLLQSISDGTSSGLSPITREEQYLSFIAGETSGYPQKPITRKEQFLEKIAQGGTSGGGAGVNVQPLNVNNNGTYTAPIGVAYSPVQVSVNQNNTVVDVDALPTEGIDQGKIYRVTSGTETTYGIPDEANNKTVYEHTSATGWKELGAGGGGGAGIIDVTELPTENIDENAVYRVTQDEAILWLAFSNGNMEFNMPFADFLKMDGGEAIIYLVDALPDVMEPLSDTVFPCYILESTGVAYVSQDGTSASAMPIGELMGGVNAGWIDSTDNIVLSPRPTFYSIRSKSITYGIPNTNGDKEIYQHGTEWTRIDGFDALMAEKETLSQTVDELAPYASFTEFMECYTDELWSTSQKLLVVDYNRIYGQTVPHRVANVKSIVIPKGVSGISSSAFTAFSNLTTVFLPNTMIHIFGSVFGSALTTINYAGTKEEWKAISKGDGWDNGTLDYIIICTDGTIAKDGTET